MIAQKLKSTIRNVPNFPKEGIIFRDITPVLQDADLCNEITQNIVDRYTDYPPDAVAAIESRGFLFGFLIATALHIPFIPIRKKGKLPYQKIAHTYDLEYGEAEIEVHTDAIKPGQKIMIHDDLLATGGTAKATAELVKKLNGKIHSFTFLVELDFLKGRNDLKEYASDIYSLVHY